NGYSHLENYLEALVFGVVSKSMSPFLEKVKIYPNLVLDQISIQNDQNFIINELRFYDMMGRVIANKVVAIKNGDIYTFDMSDFIAGSYLLVCNAEGNQVRYKVVKGI
ncbi:MAG TPA: T9SS type A sorting domain-containing protein, partial [Saprospiraceae bacterium]|nr:T9SS type A sorting domain-containing protein [Saprospiraceae bacterium]